MFQQLCYGVVALIIGAALCYFTFKAYDSMGILALITIPTMGVIGVITGVALILSTLFKNNK